MLKVVDAETKSQIAEAIALFREYETQLGLDLCFQGFEEELRNLPGKYARPEGRLLLAYSNDSPVGCIAMRKLEDQVCEMKRLYVRNEFRGSGIGNTLIERLIEDARHAGYKRMRLDTFPSKMEKAVKLYKSYGFREIPAYYKNPHGETIFMELEL